MAFNLFLQQRSQALGKSRLGNPDVVVSHDWLTAVAGHRIATRWGIPHVWTVHDTVFGKRAGRIEEPEDKLTFAIESWATREADLLLVNSRAIGEEIVARYAGRTDRIRLLHPGLDPARFEAPPPAARLAAFRSVFASPDEILFTYCGRLDLEKGIDTLINAFSIAKRRVPNARLAIAGRGKLQPIIEDHVRRLELGPSVHLYGYLEGAVLNAFYHASDIHVCPSRYEPFGLVAVEAMAAGKPVVVSATGGLRDIVSDTRVGRAVPPQDVGALASALTELALDPGLRERIGRVGREHVRDCFSWSSLGRTAVQHYACALANERAA
jgi:glycogen(starch) synthase